MPARPVTRVTGYDGSEMGAAPITPSPDTAPHRLMPDMRGFSATLGSDWRGLSTFAPVRFSYLGSGTVCRGWDAVNPAKCPKQSIPVSPLLRMQRIERLLVYVVATILAVDQPPTLQLLEPAYDRGAGYAHIISYLGDRKR